MAARDLVHEVKVSQNLAPAARTTTVSGATLDMAEFNSVVFAFEFGVVTDGTHTPSLEEAPDVSGSPGSWTAVAAGDLLGSQLAAVTNSSGGSSVQKVGYGGSKRFVRGKIAAVGTTTGAVDGITTIQGHAFSLPQ